MTNEEVVRILQIMKDELILVFDHDRKEALSLAISALREQDLQPTCNNLATDTISRQAAINALENTECELLPEEWDELTDAIMNVPSAQSDGIPLEWIDKHLEWLDNCDNDFAQLAKVAIRAMVETWKKDRT